MDSQEQEVEDQHFSSLLPTLCSFSPFVTAGLVLLTFCLLMQIGRHSFFFNVTGARWRQLNFCFGKLLLSFLQMFKLLSQFVCKKKDPARPIVLVHVRL